MKTDLAEKFQNDSNFCSKSAALPIGFLAGIIAGFLIAPIKNGMYLFSNNCIDSHEITGESKD
ncbi:MAG: hypothetical protein PUC41_07550 [Oscillospiraceae bacterium]|nr:hypothetical protein [Oscillospiraceae bacterium]